MGLTTEFIYVSDPSVTVNLTKFDSSVLWYLGYNTHFHLEEFITSPTSVPIEEFAESTSGRLHGSCTVEYKMEWDLIAKAVSGKVTLYYMTEEGFPFRITLDPQSSTSIHEDCTNDSWVRRMKAVKRSSHRRTRFYPMRRNATVLRPIAAEYIVESRRVTRSRPQSIVTTQYFGCVDKDKYNSLNAKIPWTIISFDMERAHDVANMAFSLFGHLV
jgi:hypothetical protein